MSQRLSAGSEASLAVSEVSVAYQTAMADGHIDEYEDMQIRALLSEAICNLELLSLSIEAAVQLLRIPGSAPNRHLREREREVHQQLERFQQEKERGRGE